ncbi:hypothetical protein [Mesorhizobium sp.]|uniref:hypothetical protein n=1 Tax=Mesorhizobium sp. TaxID=1871066 RepID=UPI0025EC001F|nr:hypothetical protein [Mesorhizobium sp.]
MTNSFHTVTVEKAAEAYVLSRGRVRFLSMAQAIRTIRTLMSACKATERELEELLAPLPSLMRAPSTQKQPMV